jgi:hypothetical protein
MQHSGQPETRNTVERRITDNYHGGGTGLMQPMTVDSSQMNSKLIENLFLIDIN